MGHGQWAFNGKSLRWEIGIGQDNVQIITDLRGLTFVLVFMFYFLLYQFFCLLKKT